MLAADSVVIVATDILRLGLRSMLVVVVVSAIGGVCGCPCLPTPARLHPATACHTKVFKKLATQRTKSENASEAELGVGSLEKLAIRFSDLSFSF